MDLLKNSKRQNQLFEIVMAENEADYGKANE